MRDGNFLSRRRKRQVEAVLVELCQRFADVTRRELGTVRATIQQLDITAKSSSVGSEFQVEVDAFKHEKGLWRIWKALQIVEKLGISPDAVGKLATHRPTSETAYQIRDTIKAKYELEDWQRIAKPIFDKLRQRRRDALVSHILHHPAGEISKSQSAFRVLSY